MGEATTTTTQDLDDEAQLREAIRHAREWLDRLGLSADERRFAEAEGRRLIEEWISDRHRLAGMAAGRLRPRAIPAVFAFALAGVESLYQYALKHYPSRGA